MLNETKGLCVAIETHDVVVLQVADDERRDCVCVSVQQQHDGRDKEQHTLSPLNTRQHDDSLSLELHNQLGIIWNFSPVQINIILILNC